MREGQSIQDPRSAKRMDSKQRTEMYKEVTTVYMSVNIIAPQLNYIFCTCNKSQTRSEKIKLFKFMCDNDAEVDDKDADNEDWYLRLR